VVPYFSCHKGDYLPASEWRSGLQKMLEAGGLYAPDPDTNVPSPVKFIYVRQSVDSPALASKGERLLCFAISPICSQDEIEALFAPYKAKIVASYFNFSIPFSYFDGW
jgi:hypothetical protein